MQFSFILLTKHLSSNLTFVSWCSRIRKHLSLTPKHDSNQTWSGFCHFPRNHKAYSTLWNVMPLIHIQRVFHFPFLMSATNKVIIEWMASDGQGFEYLTTLGVRQAPRVYWVLGCLHPGCLWPHQIYYRFYYRHYIILQTYMPTTLDICDLLRGRNPMQFFSTAADTMQPQGKGTYVPIL